MEYMNYVIVVTVVVFAVVMVRRARHLLGTMVPPPRVTLAAARPGSAHARDIRRYARDLEARGFTRIGTFRPEPMRGIILTAFVQPHESLCTIVYTHSVLGSFVDVVARSESGKSFTVTSAPAGQQLDQRDGHEKLFDRDMNIGRMIDLVKQRRPDGPPVSWSHGDFTRMFETAYAEEMDWRAGRGGVTSAEVRRTAEAMGGKYSEHDIQEATHRLQRQYSASRRNIR